MQKIDGNDYSETAKDIAKLVGITDSMVRRRAPELEKKGLAIKIGRPWRFLPEAAEYLKNMPEKRGRKKSMFSKLNSSEIETLRRMYDSDKLTIEEICNFMQISKTTLYAYLKKQT